MKKLLLIPIFLLSLSLMGCSNDKKDDAINVNSCNLEGERLGRIKESNVRLFFNVLPTGYYEKSYIIVHGEEDTALLRILPGMTHDLICNFPSDAREWKVPDEGIDVELEGIRYKYLGFYPADRVVYDLELTTLKRK